MSDKRINSDLYFIYQYNCYQEAKQATKLVIKMVDVFAKHLGEGVNMPYVFRAKNIMVIYTPNPINYYPNPEIYRKSLKLIDYAFFYILNNGKIIIYKGNSKNWDAVVKIRYYEHPSDKAENALNVRAIINNVNEITTNDNYYEIVRVLKYKGKYLPKQEFNYKYWGPNGKGSGEDIIIGYQEIQLPVLHYSELDINSDEEIKFQINWNTSSELISLEASPH